MVIFTSLKVGKRHMKKMKTLNIILNTLLLINIIKAQSPICPWVLTVSDTNLVYKQTNCLEGTWSLQPITTNNTLVDIEVVDECLFFAVGLNNTILRSMDNGENWIILSNTGMPTNTKFSEVKFLNSTLGYITGNNNTILKTIDRGNTWTNVAPPFISVNNRWNNIWLVDSNTVIAVGDSGLYAPTLAKSLDGGNTWTFYNTGAQSTIYGVFFIDSLTGFISTNFGNILKTTNGGLTWETKLSQTQNNTSPQLGTIFFINGKKGFVIGGRDPTAGNSGGKIYFTIDSGNTWATNNSYTDKYYSCIAFENETTGYITGGHVADNTSTILKTVDGGVTWVTEPTNFNRLVKLDVKTVNSQYVVGLDGTIIKLCHGNNVRLQAKGAESYLWSNGSTNDIIEVSPTETTTYTVTGTKYGCSQLEIITVNVPALAANSLTVCAGQPVTITANGFSSCVWSPDSSLNTTTGATVTATPLVTTTYTVTELSGCLNLSQTITINVNQLPNSIIKPDIVTTNNIQSPIIIFTGSNGTPPYTFYYTVNGGNTQTISTLADKDTVSLLVPSNSPTTYVYKTISVTDGNGCSQNQEDSIVFKINPPLSINASSYNTMVEISPNPVNKQLNITVNTPSTILITELTGREVYTATIQAGKSMVDVTNLTAGVYFIIIENGNSTITKKIIKY